MTVRRVFVLSAFLGVLVVGTSRPASREEAPRFAVPDVTGTTIALDTLLAKGPVLLDFWATWCRPCAAALPELQRLHETWREQGLSVIGISIDGPRNIAKVRPFAARAGLTYPILIDRDGDLQRDYHVTSVPTTILIDAGGSIVHVSQGYRPGDGEALGARVRALFSPDSTTAH